MVTTIEAIFAPPGPGAWALETTHFTKPVTRFHAEVFPAPFIRGFAESLRRYGSLLDYLDWAFVNGFPYYSPRPVGAPPGAVGHPPRHVWQELVATDPEIRTRLETSSSVFERKLWREDLQRFDREAKPAAIRRHLELLAVEPQALAEDALLEYLDRCRENQIRGCYVHHLYNVPALLPIGDFLVHAQEWTGRSDAELLGLLQGATPDPLAAAAELEGLAAALRRNPTAAAALEGEDALTALRTLPEGAAYVGRVAYRPANGEDVGDPNVIEVPGLIVESVRAALEVPAVAEEAAGRAGEVRTDVPPSRRAEFDELLDEARRLYRLRDERGTYCDLWAIGIMRRALLAAGRRLVDAGRLEESAHLVEAGYTEVRTLLATGEGPSASELADRARYREEASYRDAPSVLGGEPGPPLPFDWLPPASARLERGLGAAVQALFGAPPPRTEERLVRGLGVSEGIYVGPARVISNTGELGCIRQGDVLVTNATTTAFNIVLPLLGAIVTDRGGLLSHAAIVAREFGVPAVVGCTDATAVIPDGAHVRIDGLAGEVEVVG